MAAGSRQRREKKGAAGENHLDTERSRLRSQAAAWRTQGSSFNWRDAWRRTARQRRPPRAAEGSHRVSRDVVQQMLKNHPLQDGEHVHGLPGQPAGRAGPRGFFFFLTSLMSIGLGGRFALPCVSLEADKSSGDAAERYCRTLSHLPACLLFALRRKARPCFDVLHLPCFPKFVFLSHLFGLVFNFFLDIFCISA